MYQFEGVVVDGDGNPLAAATITLYPADWDRSPTSQQGGTSNADGSFDAGWCCAPGVDYFRMIVIKDGYETDSRIVEPDAINLRIVLERAGNAETNPGSG